MEKLMIESFDDLLTLREIFERNDITAELTSLFNEHGNEVGAMLRVSNKVYFWSINND